MVKSEMGWLANIKIFLQVHSYYCITCDYGKGEESVWHCEIVQLGKGACVFAESLVWNFLQI